MSSFYTSIERSSNNILWRGYKNGKRFSKKVQFQPTLFKRAKTETKYRSLYDDNVFLEPQTFASMSEAKDFVDRFKDVHGMQIYGNTNYVTSFIQENYPSKIEFDMKSINILSFDIEVDISEKFPDMETADNEITSIAIKSSKTNTYHLLGRKDYDKYKTATGINPDDIEFMKFDSERDLLRRFIQIWTNDFPDIVTGWNVEYFDVYYIIMRIIRVLGEAKAKELSPWNYIKKTSIEKFGRTQNTYQISGITVVDYMDAFKKFGYKYGTQESYKLDHIAHVILGMNKLKYENFGNLIDTHRFITDGAKDVKIPKDIPDEDLEIGEIYAKRRDMMKEELIKRGIIKE
jgi:DNA polymerase elongation subunit (family B)